MSNYVWCYVFITFSFSCVFVLLFVTGFGFSNGYCCGTSSILFLPSSILFLQPISVAFGTLIHGVSIICKGYCAPAKICWHTFYPFGVKVWLPTPTFHFYYTNVPFHLYVLLTFHSF